MRDRRGGRDPRAWGSSGGEPHHDALEQARRGWLTTGAVAVVVGLAIAATSALGLTEKGDRAPVQDSLALAVGLVFILLGGWLVGFRARRQVTPGYRSGAAPLLLVVVAAAGGILLLWDIASHLF